jgi:cytolysin (calcineurin-like family phosphatase)
MDKPDFASMTKKELKAYAMIHRDDDAVFKELIKRVEEDPNKRTFSYDMTPEEEKEVIEMFRRSGAGEKSE